MTIAEFDQQLTEWAGEDRTTGDLVWALATCPWLKDRLLELVEAEEVRIEADRRE
jgi:hypothetical protein